MPEPIADAHDDTRGSADLSSLITALLLAVAGLCVLPAGLFTQAYYDSSRDVATAAAPASVVPALILTAAAVTRGSRTFLLVMSGAVGLHGAGLLAIATAASAGPMTSAAFGSPLVQLACAAVGIAMAWRDRTRPEPRRWPALVPVAFGPVVGVLIETAPWAAPWGPTLAADVANRRLWILALVVAAGLVSLPQRRVRLAGVVLTVAAGLRLAVPAPGSPPGSAGLGLTPDTVTALILQLAAIGLAVIWGLRAAMPSRSRDVADGDAEDHDLAGAALPVAALAVLVLTMGLEVPDLFAHGPGIQPGMAGTVPLIGLLVAASVPAALTLTAGAATLGSRKVLVAATGFAAILVLTRIVSRATVGSLFANLTMGETLPFVAIALSLGLAWAALRRSGGGTALRWWAVVPLVFVASPLRALADPVAMQYGRDPMVVERYVLAGVSQSLVAVVVAALIGVAYRGTRIAAAVLLGVLAVLAVGSVMHDVTGLRVLTALNLLRVAGFGMASVLVMTAVLASRRSTVDAGSA